MARLRPETLRMYVTMTRNIIIEVARGKRKYKHITYYELMDEMGGPGRGYIAEVLDKVSCDSYTKDEILLSALVIHTPSGGSIPGDGFWHIGILPKSVGKASKKEKTAFWKKECNKVWSFYSS